MKHYLQSPKGEPAAMTSTLMVRQQIRLTRQQWQVLELVAEGRSDNHIAALRQTTPRAVRALVARIFERTNPGETLSLREQVVRAQEIIAERGN
jgi:DNA-binding NarL/FixJ family response regulator